MKKLLYLAVIAMFVASCSSSQFSGSRMNYGHKDVVKSEVTKKAKVTNEVTDNVAPVAQKQEVKKSLVAKVKQQAKAVAQAKAVKKAIKEAAVAPVAVEELEVAEVIEALNAPVANDVFISDEVNAESSKEGRGPDKWVLYLLAWFVPFVAVGLVTDWDLNPVLINILLTALCGIPGIIHAMIVVSRNA